MKKEVVGFKDGIGYSVVEYEKFDLKRYFFIFLEDDEEEDVFDE